MGELGDNGVLSGSLRAPLTVTRIFLDPARSRCSHSQTPCQVPRFSLPSETGTVKLDPKKHAFTCAGMSSGPSQECRKGMSSGTIRLSIISMSSLTSGSQFSLMARLADVCSNWMCIKPTANCDNSGSWRRISSVTRWTPRCWGRKCILRCSHAGWPTMRPWPMPEPEPLLWLAEHAMLLSRDRDDGWGWGWWDGGGVRPRWQLATVVTVVPAPPTAETSSSLAAAAEPAEHPAASTLATVARCPWPDATMLTIQVYPVKKAATLTGAGVGLNLFFSSRLSNTGI